MVQIALIVKQGGRDVLRDVVDFGLRDILKLVNSRRPCIAQGDLDTVVGSLGHCVVESIAS